MIKALRDGGDILPAFAHDAIGALLSHLGSADGQIEALEKKIMAWHRADARSRRLATIPGVGPITASAIAASVPDTSLFRSGRQFAAWIGLTPRAHSSGGKDRLTGISKQGDAYFRRLLVVGATAVLRYARQANATRTWASQLRSATPNQAANPSCRGVFIPQSNYRRTRRAGTAGL